MPMPKILQETKAYIANTKRANFSQWRFYSDSTQNIDSHNDKKGAINDSNIDCIDCYEIFASCDNLTL